MSLFVSGFETTLIQEVILFPYGDPENRTQYRGDVCNGIPWGHGSMTWSFGATYTGSWKKGKRHGVGTYILKSNDSELIEEFKQFSEPTREAKESFRLQSAKHLDDDTETFRLTKTEEAELEAEFDDFRLSILKIERPKAGDEEDVYRGTWENDQMHGFGVYNW